ncbi:MAG: TetR/AcrR family transcriptional regulator [Pseudomonadota bacterium]
MAARDSSDDRPGRRGYHHGNLRQALVEATLDLIVEKGPHGFTLAEAARSAGVSPAAVYRHFSGREELIAEVARQGFETFADLMEHAWAKYHPAPLAAFEAVGRAYLAFARRQPGHYIAMFESGIGVAGDPDLAPAAERAMSVLTHAAEALSAHLPPDRRPPASMVSHHIWALSHGVVELFARGEPGARAPFSPEELLETGTGIYLRGLGLIPKDEA